MIKRRTLSNFMKLAERGFGIWRNADPSICDQNFEVWQRFYQLCLKHKCTRTTSSMPTVILDGPLAGFAALRSPFVGRRDANYVELEFPILHQTCYPHLPVNCKQMEEEASELVALGRFLNRHVYFEAMTFNGQQDTYTRAVNLNSPVCRLAPTPDLTVATLTKSRRYRMRNCRPAEIVEVDEAWVVDTLSRRYVPSGSEYEYALIQSLWSFAVETVMPECVTWLGVKDERGNLTAAGSFIRRGAVAHFQSNVRTLETTEVGDSLLLGAIHRYCGDSEVEIVDPTCRTSFAEQSIEVYKRAIVNEDRVVPMYAYLLQPEQEAFRPYFDGSSLTWIAPDANDPLTYGKPV